MMEIIVIEFQNITKFPLVDYLQEYENFMNNSYYAINNYFSGNSESIDNSHMRALSSIMSKSKTLLAQFKNFSNKFNKCGYWELMDLIDDINNNIEKISKLPKFRRTVLAKRGYTGSVEVGAEVGSMRTIDDVAQSVSGINGESTTWVDLMLNNDWNEDDWEIDKLSSVNVYVNNKTDLVVNSIVDMPIGQRVYGIDIDRKIGFESNDFKLTKYTDNIEQKCDILLGLTQGDVPENMLFGRDPQLTTSSYESFSYPELALEISNVFRQNDLFSSAQVDDISFDEENHAMVNVNIRTKYNYNTEKRVSV